MSEHRNNNTNSDDFDLDFSKKSAKRSSEQINRPEEVHIPIRNSAPSRRPVNKGKKSKKYKPPKETIFIYVIIAMLILIIVTVVFIISFNSTKNTESGTNDDGSSSLSAYMISVSSSSDTTSTETSSSDSDSVSSVPESITVPVGYEYKYADDDLFIGDSIFTGLSGYGILDAHNVAAEIGFTPYGAHYNTLSDYDGTAVDYAGNIKPKHINIMLGSNTLTPSTSYTDLIDSYKSLINALKEVSPDSQICVISVPPVTKDSSAADAVGITKDIINTANQHIQKMCTDLNIKYFDLNSQLSDSDGYFKEEYAEMDGLHFQYKAYDVLLYGLEQIWK